MAVSTTENSSTQVRFREALHFPLYRRCAKLSELLAECSAKELGTLFPILVEHIFGLPIGAGQGWGLLSTIRLSTDFNVLLGFLHPQGVLFDVIYKLTTDVYLKYQYPVTMLPSSHQQSICNSAIDLPPFYQGKLQMDAMTGTPTALLLNPFEFYMFHFAYHLVSPWITTNRSDMGFENAYLHLSDQYLSHFLPVETSVVLPVVQLHPTMILTRSPPPQAQPARISKLFKSTAAKLGSASLSPPNLNAQQRHNSVWRSETLLHVAIHIWLAVPQGDLFHERPQDVQGSASSLPSEHHLRVVRNLIKHLHYFSNNLHQDNSATDDLRRMVLPLCHRPLYSFLRTHIHRWPLDSSFLLILETYLSFLQPWRYIHYSARIQQGEPCIVDRTWSRFVCENLVAYSVVIQDMIPRFQRLDLTTPRHAHMLYRLAKVISQPYLADIIRDHERCVEEGEAGGGGRALPQKVFDIVKSQLAELEPGGHASYPPLLHRSASELKVRDLMLTCQTALISVKEALNAYLAERKRRSASLMGAVKDWLMLTGDGEEYSLTEREKTITYLEQSMTMLSEVFGVRIPEIPITESVNETGRDSSNYSTSGTLLVGSLNAREMMARTKLIKYEGTPELQPIRSFEIAALVRMLHHFCYRVNQTYGPQLRTWYERPDLWGGVTRQLLAAPCEARFFDKRYVPAKLTSEFVPARLSLRPLASWALLLWFFLLTALVLIFGYPLIPVYLLFVFLFGVLVLLRAFLEPWLHGRATPARRPFVPLDVSFNE